MLGGLAAALFIHDRVRTTEAKAKALRPVAERLITFAKRGQGDDAQASVHARREVLKVIPDRDVVHRLFADIAPRFGGREGGYTRILKLGPRKGDGAPMAQIELVEQDEEQRERAKAQARAASARARRRRSSELEEPEGMVDEQMPGVEEPVAEEKAEEKAEKKPRRRLRRRKSEEE